MQFENETLTATEKYIEIDSEVDNSTLKQGWSMFYLQDLTAGVPINLGVLNIPLRTAAARVHTK
ncbi:MAG: hypothetical protein WCB79_07040 [Halobacteriota archaeon]